MKPRRLLLASGASMRGAGLLLVAALFTVTTGFAQSTSGPNAAETVQFIVNHVHPYRAECVSANRKDFQGQVLEIQSMSVSDGVLNITYDEGAGGESSSSTASHHIDVDRNQHLAVTLRTVRVSSIHLEHLPYKEMCDLAAEGDHQPYRNTETPEWWLRFSDGQHDLSMFGLPVQDEDEGGRVKNALLHLIELAGGQTKEAF